MKDAARVLGARPIHLLYYITIYEHSLIGAAYAEIDVVISFDWVASYNSKCIGECEIMMLTVDFKFFRIR